MKLKDDVDLTYCSNMHPGETWDEVRANQFEFTTGKTSDDLPLRADDLTQMHHLFFNLNDLVQRLLAEPRR